MPDPKHRENLDARERAHGRDQGFWLGDYRVQRWLIFDVGGVSIQATDQEDVATAYRRGGARVEGPFVPASQLEGAVERLDAAEAALVLQLGSRKLAEIAIQRRLEARRADSDPGGR